MALSPGSRQIRIATACLPEQIPNVAIALMDGADDPRCKPKLLPRILLRKSSARQRANIFIRPGGLDQRGQNRRLGAEDRVERRDRHLRLPRNGLQGRRLVALFREELAGGVYDRGARGLSLLLTARRVIFAAGMIAHALDYSTIITILSNIEYICICRKAAEDQHGNRRRSFRGGASAGI